MTNENALSPAEALAISNQATTQVQRQMNAAYKQIRYAASFGKKSTQHHTQWAYLDTVDEVQRQLEAAGFTVTVRPGKVTMTIDWRSPYLT